MRKTIRFEEVEHSGDLDAVVSDLNKSGARVVSCRPDYLAETATATVEIQDPASFLKAFKKTDSYQFSTVYRPEPDEEQEPIQPGPVVDAVPAELWQELERIGDALDKIETDHSLTEAEKEATALEAAGAHTSTRNICVPDAH